MIKVSDIMTFGVATIRAETPLLEALNLMHAHRIAGLPVVDEHGNLVGLVSEADFFGNDSEDCLVASLLELNQPGRDAQLRQRITAEVMKTRPPVIDGDVPLADAARTIAQRHVDRLPVVDAGKLVGMLSRSDLLNYLANPDRP